MELREIEFGKLLTYFISMYQLFFQAKLIHLGQASC